MSESEIQQTNCDNWIFWWNSRVLFGGTS